jgi:hypothetical protein
MTTEKSKEWTDYVKPQDMGIAFLWANFAGFVLPADASETQRNEMRKAYYAGFFECFKVMNDYAVRLPEDEAAKLFERLCEENEQFFNKMMKEHLP